MYRLYQGSDGQWFFLALGNMSFVTKFAVAMDHAEWLADPRFEGAPLLILPPVNTELIAMFKDIFVTKTRDEWLEFLRGADIPCSPAATVAEFMDDPQVLANDMVVTVEEPHIGKVREMGVPVKMELTPGQVRSPSPTPGQHTQETLNDLGYSEQKIARLKEEGVI